MDEEVKKLAETLRANGIAATDSRAREMAQDILGVQRKTQGSFEEKKHDPEVNPQQQSGSFSTDGGQKAFDMIKNTVLEMENMTTAEATKPAPEPVHEPEIIEEPVVEVVEPTTEEETPVEAVAEPTVQEAPLEEPVQVAPPVEEVTVERPEEPVQDVVKEKKENPKVDLNEMFNFSKR